MAEAFGNMYGIDIIKPYSSGSHPSGIVNPKAIESMEEVDYDLSTHSSKPITVIPDIEYDLVINMGCGDECPTISAKERQDWDIPDPKNMNMKEFSEVRDLISDKVRELIDKVII